MIISHVRVYEFDICRLLMANAWQLSLYPIITHLYCHSTCIQCSWVPFHMQVAREQLQHRLNFSIRKKFSVGVLDHIFTQNFTTWKFADLQYMSYQWCGTEQNISRLECLLSLWKTTERTVHRSIQQLRHVNLGMHGRKYNWTGTHDVIGCKTVTATSICLQFI